MNVKWILILVTNSMAFVPIPMVVISVHVKKVLKVMDTHAEVCIMIIFIRFFYLNMTFKYLLPIKV